MKHKSFSNSKINSFLAFFLILAVFAMWTENVSANSTLSSLIIKKEGINILTDFSSSKEVYNVELDDVSDITISAIPADKLSKVSISQDGGKKYSNHSLISLHNGENTISVNVINGGSTKVYTLNLKAPEVPAADGYFTWDNANVYFVIPDRFYNGNTSNDNSYGRFKTDALGKKAGTFHGGDIAGLSQKLDEGYFEKLGVNAIWVTAPYEQIHGWCSGGTGGDFAHFAYHGYYVLDYTGMDKNMGTIEEFRTFVEKAHQQNIRVVLDIVMNHAGYTNLKDMEDYGYGSLNGISTSWSPSNGQNYGNVHNHVNYNSDADKWAKFWGKSWVRAGLAGYDGEGSGEVQGCLQGLPDFKTEVTNNVGLAPILVTKWGKETSGFDNWILPSAKSLRKDLGIAPAEYIIRWLAAWVREFGIDGFRCDTGKHIENWRWKQLQEAADKALKEWRAANPNNVAGKWTDDFWMTVEHYGHGPDYNATYHNNGFESIINFQFPKDGNVGSIAGTWANYANKINQNHTWNTLSYISSHDEGLTRGNMVNLGTCLVLSPGGVQIFYGDETGRPHNSEGVSDNMQGSRSDMNFGSNADVLAHWQKLGSFRKRNASVGAGLQTDLGNQTYGRKYSKGNYSNNVAIKLSTNSGSSYDINVSGIFDNGTVVQDAYNVNNKATVLNGKITIKASGSVILLEKEVAVE